MTLYMCYVLSIYFNSKCTTLKSYLCIDRMIGIRILITNSIIRKTYSSAGGFSFVDFLRRRWWFVHKYDLFWRKKQFFFKRNFVNGINDCDEFMVKMWIKLIPCCHYAKHYKFSKVLHILFYCFHSIWLTQLNSNSNTNNNKIFEINQYLLIVTFTFCSNHPICVFLSLTWDTNRIQTFHIN